MIIDRIANSNLYYGLNPGIERAFRFISQTDLHALGAGRYEIDGDNIYAMIQQYDSKPLGQGFWEAHRRYIDLQFIVLGMERIGYANINRLAQGAYDASKDFLPLYGEGDFLTLAAGHFALLLPEDAHMPGIAVASPALVKKVVVKIAVP